MAIYLAVSVPVHAEENAAKLSRPLILDRIHHNPGELLESAYEDPTVIKGMGYNGKV